MPPKPGKKTAEAVENPQAVLVAPAQTPPAPQQPPPPVQQQPNVFTKNQEASRTQNQPLECIKMESEEAVICTLQKRNMPQDSLIKLLLVGDSGVGKSFLLNCLCEENLFISDFSATGVTIDNELVLLFFPDFPPLLVYNIPGLVEAEPERVAANKLQISKAFREFPEAKVACAFVFSAGNGGRVSPEQVTAFDALLTFVGLTPETASQFFTTLMNRVNFSDDDGNDVGEMALLKYQCEAEFLMNATLGNKKGPVIPLTTLPLLFKGEKKVGSAKREALKRQLQIAVAPVIVKARRLVEIPADRKIMLEKEKLEAALEDMKARLSTAQTNMKKNYDKVEERVAKVKEESDKLAGQYSFVGILKATRNFVVGAATCVIGGVKGAASCVGGAVAGMFGGW